MATQTKPTEKLNMATQTNWVAKYGYTNPLAS